MIRASLRNPHAVVVLALGILVIGLTSVARLPTDILPTFKTPAVQILTFYPGMPAEVMEKDITTRLERWTGQANGVARQESKSMVGVSIVKDFFREDVEANTAMAQVTSLAMSDLYYLPRARSRPW
jgi:multidrug efflux pump subunit AcrB